MSVWGHATQMNPPMNAHWALVYCAHVLEFSFDVISIFLPSVFIDATKMNRTEKRVQFKDAAVATAATTTITRRRGRARGRSRGREAIAHRCLPFLAWLLRRFCVAFGTLLTCHEIVVCWLLPILFFCIYVMCVCVRVCQLETVQRVVQSPLQITCGQR